MVVAVPLVEAGQVRRDLVVGLSLGLLAREPGPGAVVDEARHVLVVLGLAVGRLVVLELDPVAHVAVDRVAAARHLLVDTPEGLTALLIHAVEEHVQVVLTVEVLDPVGAVVGLGRLLDVVVHRARRSVREARVDVAAELDEEGQHLVAVLQLVLRPLARGDADGLGALAVLDLGLAGDDLLVRLLDDGAALLLEAVGTVVLLAAELTLLVRVCGGSGDGGGDLHGRRDQGSGCDAAQDADDASGHGNPPVSAEWSAPTCAPSARRKRDVSSRPRHFIKRVMKSSRAAKVVIWSRGPAERAGGATGLCTAQPCRADRV